MSNLEKWAMKQIGRLEIPDEKKKQYSNILNAFREQGHSGFSASYALGYINLYIEKEYGEVKTRLDKMLKGKNADGMQTVITKDILQIIDMFREYGLGKDEAHNLSRLMSWKPIIPLTGAEDEWSEYSDEGSHSQQNKICSAVFRDHFDNSTAHWLYGRIYSDNGGHTWFTTGGRGSNRAIRSSIPITFPFWVPDKSEYIYLNGEDSEEIITDKARIKELYDEWDKQFVD